jgi:hypothetical protein
MTEGCSLLILVALVIAALFLRKQAPARTSFGSLGAQDSNKRNSL